MLPPSTEARLGRRTPPQIPARTCRTSVALPPTVASQWAQTVRSSGEVTVHGPRSPGWTQRIGPASVAQARTPVASLALPGAFWTSQKVSTNNLLAANRLSGTSLCVAVGASGTSLNPTTVGKRGAYKRSQRSRLLPGSVASPRLSSACQRPHVWQPPSKGRCLRGKR